MKPGDKVTFLNDTGTGTIVKISGKIATILREDGFEVPMPVELLIVVKNSHWLDDDATLPVKDGNLPARHSKSKSHLRKKELEVDLHFENLTPGNDRMSAHEKLTLQLDSAKNALQKARNGNYTHLVLVHGVGQGRLKEELHKWLQGQQRLEFYDASLQKYGFGATEVRIW